MNRFIAKVVDVNDPEKAGRIKIRVYQMHDDTTRIPDDMLPWARCVFPVTNPVHKGVAGATTGLVKDSTVVGYFVDDHNQLPMIDGVLGAVDDKTSDFPPHDKGDDHNPVLNDSILHIGTAELKFLTNKTIGPIKYAGQNIGTMLNQIGEGKIHDSFATAKGILSSFNDLKDMVTNSPIEQVNSVIQGFASDFSQIGEDAISSIITSDLGNVVGSQVDSGVISDITDANKALDSVSHIIGAVGTRKSKSPINTAADALNKLSGNRFIMGNIMGKLDSSISRLRINMKG